MPVILKSAIVAPAEDSCDHQELLESFEKYLVAKSFGRQCAVNAMPAGVGPDSDGIILYLHEAYWVVAHTCRGSMLNPSFFSSLSDAIAFVKLKLR